MILISLLPSIQRCSSKFWAWSCIASNFDKGRRGDHKHKIINWASLNVWSAVKPKQGTVSQVFLQVVVAKSFWQGFYHVWNCWCLYWKFHNLITHEALRCSYESLRPRSNRSLMFHCHATKKYIENRLVEEAKKMKCYKTPKVVLQFAY